jgi:hypothetical protein
MQQDPLFGNPGSPAMLNRYAYAGNDPTTLADPSGMVAVVMQDGYAPGLVGFAGPSGAGAGDNACFSTAGGALWGLAVNAACLDMPLGLGSYVVVVTPTGSLVMPTTVFARPSGGAGPSTAGPGQGNVSSGEASANGILDAALRWLGQGYREVASGVFRSADDLRQFRMTDSDLTDPRQGPHAHFESIGPNGRDIIENGHVEITN